MTDYNWYEINIKDWDKLGELTREIFIDNNGKLSFAGRADVLVAYGIKAIRKIK